MRLFHRYEITIIGAFFGSLICTVTGGFFQNCNQNIQLGAYESYSLNSPGYPRYGYVPGSSCQYLITAPKGYEIQANCNINIPMQNGQCTTENFYIFENTNGGAPTPYCGSGNLNENTVNNRLTVAYTSTSDNQSGTFSCILKSVPQTCDCGWNMNTRIVGGTNVQPNEYPPMAGLMYVPGQNVFCGATIISPQYVMSAAHCFYIYNINSVNVIVGQVNIQDENAPFQNQYYVAQVYINPNYVRGSYYNDIALVQTSASMVWSRGVGPACLPFFNTFANFNNAIVQATGWGTTSYAGPIDDILQKVSLKILPWQSCQSNFYGNLSATQICTYTSGYDTCQFDSGGPLFYNGGRLFAIGVISYGEGCATNSPAVNTRVSSYIDWITSITGPLCQKAIT